MSQQHLYEGRPGGAVTVDGEPLPLRLDLFNHSPTGFAWGYHGSGPTQLALAIFAHEFGDDPDAHPAHYQVFKSAVIACLPGDVPWRLSSAEIREAVRRCA